MNRTAVNIIRMRKKVVGGGYLRQHARSARVLQLVAGESGAGEELDPFRNCAQIVLAPVSVS